MTARIREFLKRRKDEGPCLVVDLDVVRENYLAFAKSLPDSKVFYAVKANPAPEILKLLASLGCCFDVASVNETQAALEAGASPERISYGNTIKKESDIAAAFALGVTLYAIDCEAEDIIDAGRAQAERMVERTEVVREARRRAQQVVDDAEATARNLNHEAEDYIDQKLASFEVVLDRTMQAVQKGRERLQVVVDLPEAEVVGEADEGGFFDQDEG